MMGAVFLTELALVVGGVGAMAAEFNRPRLTLAGRLSALGGALRSNRRPAYQPKHSHPGTTTWRERSILRAGVGVSRRNRASYEQLRAEPRLAELDETIIDVRAFKPIDRKDSKAVRRELAEIDEWLTEVKATETTVPDAIKTGTGDYPEVAS